MYGFIRSLVFTAIFMGVARPVFASWNPMHCLFILRMHSYGLPKKDTKANAVNLSPFVDDGFRREEDAMKYLAEENPPSSPTSEHTGRVVPHKVEEPIKEDKDDSKSDDAFR